MNHYEIVFVVDPQLDKESKLFEKCLEKIKSINGIAHRSEDVGLRTLAYPINDKNTGHYYLLNFECDPKNLKEIESLFKFDESIMRSSLVKKKGLKQSLQFFCLRQKIKKNMRTHQK